jgi:hypothetical protein
MIALRAQGKALRAIAEAMRAKGLKMSHEGVKGVLAAHTPPRDGPFPRAPTPRIARSGCFSNSGASSSHLTQFNSWPRRLARPSAVRTQGRSLQGGSSRTCCPCPHSSSATHWFSASVWWPTIFRFIRT